MKKNKFFVLILIGLVVTSVVSLIAYYNIQKEDSSKSSDSQVRLLKIKKAKDASDVSAIKDIVSSMPKSSLSKKKRRTKLDVDTFEHLKPIDRKLAVAVQESLDNNDFKAVVKAVNAALKSTNPEVRENAVEALGWFGAEALPELTPLMADRDADIAEAASSHWQLALSEIEDDGLRARIAEAALPSILDENTISLVISEITSQDDELKVMQSLVNLIDCGQNKVVNVAKEEYESLTGEPWSGFDAAEAWLEENYNPED